MRSRAFAPSQLWRLMPSFLQIRSWAARSSAALAIGWPGIESGRELVIHRRVQAGDVERVAADQRRREVVLDRREARVGGLGRPAPARAGLAPADRAVVGGHLHEDEALAFLDGARHAARERAIALSGRRTGRTSMRSIFMWSIPALMLAMRPRSFHLRISSRSRFSSSAGVSRAIVHPEPDQALPDVRPARAPRSCRG